MAHTRARTPWRELLPRGAQDLAELATHLVDEVEVEPHFAQCFESCFCNAPASPVATDDGAAGAHSRALGVRCGRALCFALTAMRGELANDFQAGLERFNTIERDALDLVKALGSLRTALQTCMADTEADVLPELGQLAAQMADGWCGQIRGVLDESLQRSLRLESWDVVSDFSDEKCEWSPAAPFWLVHV